MLFQMKTINTFSLILIITLLLFSCEAKKPDLTEQWKQEILESEKNFATMVQEEGIHNAFVAYAADDAVVMRNNALVKGKIAIDKHYLNANTKSLSWSPDFIEVSKSGDLGYTYGTYQYTYKDSLEQEHVDSGIFHTVWKRQLDNSWKFVWD